jgi:hypothetical protein
MLHLQAGVHLDEVELVVLEQELDGARADVVDLGHGVGADLADPVAQLGRDDGPRRLLQHLLVAPLERAVALAQMDRVALAVAEDLDLDVPRRGEVLLDVDLVVAEGGLGLDRAVWKAVSSSPSSRATFMPRPPPPAVALMMTG